MGANLVVVDYIHHQRPHLQYQEGLAQAGEEGEHQKYIGIVGFDKEQNKTEKEIKRSILKKHTLEGVITLNKETFYNVGVTPCIAIFTTGVPHKINKISKFINFEDDGYKISKHVGLVETIQARDKKQYLLDVWFDRIEAENNFCVKTTVEEDDEWLHSFYYFNEEIPLQDAFEKTMADYLTFEFDMVLHGREYLFNSDGDTNG